MSNVKNYISQPDVSGDNALNVNGTLNFGGTFNNSGSFTNSGAVTNSGNITNSGVITSSTKLVTTSNVGTAGTGVTAVHYGDGIRNTAILTIASTLPAIAGGAALGVGKLIYTLPTGAVIVGAAYMSVGITQTQGHINSDTPVVGLGTVVASGAVSVLSGTATFQSIITGTTATNCTGTATVKTATPTAGVPLIIETAGAKTVYLNAAATWAASGDSAALIAGTVVINYTFMN